MENSIPVGIIMMMCVIGFVGVLAHWFKAACKQQAPWNLFNYLFLENKGASASMFTAYTIAMYGLYELGTFDVVKVEYITEAWNSGVIFKPFASAVVQTIGAGYACDSMFNKAGQPTKERRAEYGTDK